MNKLLYRSAFCAGLLAIGWVASAYLRTHPLALGMTALMAAFYAMGALELWRHRQALAGLRQALLDLPQDQPDLSAWLASVPAGLRPAVQGRLDGGRAALPGPSLTPYLTGLLVLLGMLGTFLGMVVTLNGTGAALDRAADLASMRESLAAPVKGLGLAFGTSVAGVAASAMLGLMAALCRREAQGLAQALDTAVATTLRPFTAAHRREAAQALQQQQAVLLPALVDRLQALGEGLQAQAQQSAAQGLAQQQQFQAQVEAAYRSLADAVARSLQHSLDDGARRAGEVLQPMVAATMDGIARESSALLARLADQALRQRAELDQGFAQRAAALVDQVARSHAALGDRLAGDVSDRLDALAARLDSSATRRDERAAAQAEQQRAAWADTLAGTGSALLAAWQQAGVQAHVLQAETLHTLEATAARITAQAETQARGTLAEIASLAQMAAQAPQAAAELVAQMRTQQADSLSRDRALLDERGRLLAGLDTLLQSVQHTAEQQRAGIDQWIAGSAAWLAQASASHAERVESESARLATLSAQITGSAVELASLGEAFGAGVDRFGEASQQLVGHLQRVDETLGRAIARSDEQLAYYVAQAREVIDLSLSAQQQIVGDLQRIAAGRIAQGSEA